MSELAVTTLGAARTVDTNGQGDDGGRSGRADRVVANGLLVPGSTSIGGEQRMGL
ncbi:hypothetical protein GCM10010399_16810 [Dactylosporangium fulvum]